MKTMNEVPFRGAAVALLISIVACSSSHVATNEKVEEATTDGEVSAASAGADWLARHQDPQGYWSAARFAEQCEGTPCGGAGQEIHDAGATGLALLALQVAGGDAHQQEVQRGLDYLLRIQDEETGCFGVPNSHSTFLYDHGIATLAVTEAVLRTKDPRLTGPAQRAIDFIHQCRNPYKAWRYAYPPDGSNDMSVTGWMVMALKTADLAGLRVDEAALEGAALLTEDLTDERTWRTGYLTRGGFSSREPGTAERWPEASTEAMTAVGMMARMLTGEDPHESEALKGGAKRLRDRLPRWDEAAGTIDYSYWYYGTLAMFELGGDDWAAWSPALREAIAPRQADEGHARGSWDPRFDPWGHAGGRVYATALLTLALATHERMGDRKIAG